MMDERIGLFSAVEGTEFLHLRYTSYTDLLYGVYMNSQSATSQQIYQCALRILEAEGPQAVSMRRVAKEVGITAMAIYHHFPSREALLDAVVDSEFEQLVGFFSPLNGKRNFEAAMIHIMDGYIDYALAHPCIFDYVFSSPDRALAVFLRIFALGARPL